MLIRVSGYNAGAQEYLEEGTKAGREFSRDELDERVILYGDLDLTRRVYESIEDKSQDRYLSITMSFKEDLVSPDTLRDVAQEFREFLMYAYKAEEFNFYAEAHIPRIRSIKDRKSGELIDRKPHIHIVIPKKNMLSGNIFDPVGSSYSQSEKYLEAFQEYINQKYKLASPRDHVRADVADAASVLSRYKGDDFYGKNREFKQSLVKLVIERNISTREGFYDLVAEHGETRVRNQGKPGEYIAVKLEGDAKFTNLKDTIFQDDFVVRRELKKPPLDQSIIRQRLLEWPQRAKEIKYISKAGPAFRKFYVAASPEDRARILADRETTFYKTYGDTNVSLYPVKRSRDHQRSVDKTQDRSSAFAPDGLQDLSIGDVANHRQAGSAGIGGGTLLLPSDAHVHLGQHQPRGDSGLRPPLSGGGRGGRPGDASRRRQPTATVSEAATGTRKRAGAAGSRLAGSRSGITDHPGSPNGRGPHRVPTIADIEARGRRLFDPLKMPEGSALVIEVATSTRSTVSPRNKASKSRRKAGDAPSTKASRAQMRKTDNPLPTYARNPHRTPTVSDIEARGRRLFDPLKRPDARLVIKLPSIKALTSNRSASTVAAYFNRQAEQNQLLPAQRQAVRRVNKQYFELRRSLFSDQRLTRQDKAQLVSVLSFERLKANEHIRYPSPQTEVNFMGSAQIRKLITEEPDDPGYSISGAKTPEPVGVRDRVKKIMNRLTLQLDPQTNQARDRELAAKDIYTRKAKYSQNVHYLDKKTDKTLFVDTGTAIAMRRTGITESGVAVALQLAKERFGSTLTINGTADFKRLVVEAAAKNGLDVHFTDKGMNESLVARRAELEIESEGQGIAPAAPEQKAPDAAPLAEQGAAEPVPAERRAEVFVPDDLVQHEAQWRNARELTEEDVRGSDTVMGARGEDHAMWLVGSNEATPESKDLIRNYLTNDTYREHFKGALEDMYSQVSSPEDIRLLDSVTAFAVEAVNQIEASAAVGTDKPGVQTPAQSPSGQPAGRKVIQGMLLDHGAAPYQNQVDKQDSYFVTLKTDAGERTVWGIALAEVMDKAALVPGDQIRLEDKGTVPVTVQKIELDGSVTEKVSHRREWTAERETPEREVAKPLTEGEKLSTSSPQAEQPAGMVHDHGHGMSTD